MISYSICLFLSHLAQFTHVVVKWQDFQDFLIFPGWIIFHCIYTYICIYIYIPHLYPSIHWHLDHFYIVNNAAVSIGEKTAVLDPVFFRLDLNPEVKSLGHILVLFLIFSRNLHAVSIVAAPIYIPISSAQGFPFLHLLVSTCYLFYDTLIFFFPWYIWLFLKHAFWVSHHYIALSFVTFMWETHY